MTISIQRLALVPFMLASSAIAATNPSISCQTVLGPVSVAKVPTTTVTLTNSVRPTQTIGVQQTTTLVTGLTSTYTYWTTLTQTTTDPTITDTYVTTTTIFNVQTETDTSTITTTSTSTLTTSSTSTTTSATTQGFKNIRDTLNQNYLPQKRELNHPHEKRATASGTAGGLQKLLATNYPSKVTCTSTAPNLFTSTVYTNLPRATKTIAYWVRHITEVDTITTTSTVVPPDVTSTDLETFISTVQTTTTVIATNTQTTSTTTTNILPGPTVYDACNNNNIFGPNFKHAGGNYYAVNVANNGPGVGSDFQVVANGAGSAYDCCTACMALGNCETFIFRQNFRNCFLLNHAGSSCPSQSQHPNFILSKQGSDTGAGYVVGNGNCGYTWSGNSDGSVFSVDPY